VVIMTSNVGAEVIKRGPLGFMTPTFDEGKYSQTEYGNQLKRLFRPEFLNRIDETIVVEPLNRDQIRRIVHLLMHDISVRMDELGFTAELTEAAAAYVTHVEGLEEFTRPQVMRHVVSTGQPMTRSRENLLRTFGTLMRQGTMQRSRRGQFELAQGSEFAERARRFAQG